MANLTEVVQFDAGVYQLETTDPVQGGENGVSNAPLKNLANRTAYLKKHIDDLESGVVIPSAVAPLASPAFTGTPTAPTQSLGNNTTRLATTAFVQGTVGGRLSKSVAGGVNVTLTAIEAGNAILEFTGALTANIAVIVPTSPTRSWVVKNGTSGSFTLTVKTAAGAGVVVTQGKTKAVYTDGTNLVACHDDYNDIAMTGVPTAPTATAGTNNTRVATTAFVKGEGIQAASVTTVASTPYTITDLQAGHIIYITTGGSVVTLPDATAWPVGKALIIQSAVPATVNRTGTQTIYCNGAGQTSISLGNGDSVTLFAVPGFGGWIAVGNSAQLGASAAFNYSIAANGYQKLPTGLILQWGIDLVPVSAYPGFTGYFPVSFPNGGLSMVAVHPGVPAFYVTGALASKSQYYLTHTSTSSVLVAWIAIGY